MVGEIRVETDKGENTWTLRLEHKGEELSRLRVATCRMRIGRTRVLVGNVGGVFTPPEHRLKGYASRLMWEAIAFLESQRCSISVMNAIANYYHRFDYTAVFPICRLLMPTKHLMRARRLDRVRRARKSEGQTLVRLFNRINSHTTGTIVRPANFDYEPLINYGSPPGKLLVVEGRNGAATGYVLCRHRFEQIFVQEFCAQSTRAFESLAAELGHQACKAGYDMVHFKLPMDHPFAQYCSRFDSRWEVEFPYDREELGRLLNVKRFMTALCPEFCHRLVNGRFFDPISLWFQTNLGDVGMIYDGSRIRIDPVRPEKALTIRMPQTVLAQLALGYRCASDAARDDDVNIHRKARTVMDLIFPQVGAVMPLG